MAWSRFATKLETAETMEGYDLNRRAPYFYPDSPPIMVSLGHIPRKTLATCHYVGENIKYVF
jgi:hypothetical protein